MYNGHGDVVNLTDATGASVARDNNGNLVQSATSYASGASVVLTLSYDPLDRQVTLRDGDRSYSYDPDSNALSIQTQIPARARPSSGRRRPMMAAIG